MPRLTRDQEQAREAAYESHNSDGAAAKAVGIHPQSFTSWRRSRGLPAKNGPWGKGTPALRTKLGAERVVVFAMRQAIADLEAAIEVLEAY